MGVHSRGMPKGKCNPTLDRSSPNAFLPTYVIGVLEHANKYFISPRQSLRIFPHAPVASRGCRRFTRGFIRPICHPRPS